MKKILNVISITLATFLPALALAQTYPAGPVHIEVGVGPGGAVDLVARASATYLQPLLGQSVIVENRPGASNLIANQFVANSAPDGLNVLSLGSSEVLIEAAAKANGQNPPFDALQQLALVATVVNNPYALVVRPDLPVKNVNDLIALAKTKPQGLTFGSTGVGKVDDIAMYMLEEQTGMKLLHVPYKGAADIMNELLGGRIDVMVNSVAPMVPFIRAGKLLLLGMMGSKRTTVFPDVPTIAEAIPLKGYAVNTWIAMGVPIKTPTPIVDGLNSAYKKMLSDPAFVSKYLTPQGLEPFYMTPADTTATFRTELEQYAKLIKDLGLKISD